MHSTAARKRLTAWLALLAMWLIVCLPTVSQVLAARQAHEPIAELCSGSASSLGYQPTPLNHEPPLGKCGYCDFLGTHPANLSLTAAAQPWQPPVQRAVAVLAVDALLPIFAVQAGHPRDPPRGG